VKSRFIYWSYSKSISTFSSACWKKASWTASGWQYWNSL